MAWPHSIFDREQHFSMFLKWNPKILTEFPVFTSNETNPIELNLIRPHTDPHPILAPPPEPCSQLPPADKHRRHPPLSNTSETWKPKAFTRRIGCPIPRPIPSSSRLAVPFAWCWVSLLLAWCTIQTYKLIRIPVAAWSAPNRRIYCCYSSVRENESSSSFDAIEDCFL